METEFRCRFYHHFHCHVQSTWISQLLKSVFNAVFSLLPFQIANSAGLPIKALDGTVNKNVSGQDQIHICNVWCSWWWLMVSILVHSLPLKTHTSTHLRRTGSMQTWPAIVLNPNSQLIPDLKERNITLNLSISLYKPVWLNNRPAQLYGEKERDCRELTEPYTARMCALGQHYHSAPPDLSNWPPAGKSIHPSI